MRTLGPVQQPGDQDESNQFTDEPFYLKNQLPMFLAQNEGPINPSTNFHQDIPICKELINSLCNNQIKNKQNMQEITQLLEQQNDLSKGMSYFAAKNLLFLEYLILLKVYQLFKLNGRSFTFGSGLELYKRLAYLKTLLLKLQPVEKKLEYQKNKILKHSQRVKITKQSQKLSSDEQKQSDQEESEKLKIKSENQADNIQKQKIEDQMAFKPRASALMKIKKDRDLRIIKNDKYEAPKVSSNLSKQDKIRQRMQRKKEVKKLGLIRRLQQDLIDDNRAQERFLGDEINEKFKRKFQQKINYEQEAFTRLPDTKKDKFYMKQMIRNSIRKNQLEEDFKQVQMVRQLFEGESEIEKKILQVKRKKELQSRNNVQKKKNNYNQKTKQIKKHQRK